MATTLVTCALRYDQAVVSHVGDSRCYLVRNRVAKQITQDHTWVNEQRKMGLITASEMATSDSRHVILRSLGPEMFVSPDTTALTLLAGDVLVLCTDGLHDEMSERDDCRDRLAGKKIEEIATELVARAVEIDGNDNTTAQVIRVRRWSRWECIADAPTGCPPERIATAILQSYGSFTLLVHFPIRVETVTIGVCRPMGFHDGFEAGCADRFLPH